MKVNIDTGAKEYVEERFIGFGPDTTSVKPVHIANGLFRTILGHTYDTGDLNRFVFWQKNNGSVQRGHELDAVYQWLRDNERMEASEITENDVAKLRVLLKKVVNADEAVYLHSDRMEYSAGFQGFVSEDRIAQDGGELIAEWLRLQESSLYNCIRENLQQSDDVVASLCTPLLDITPKQYEPSLDYSKVGFLHESLPPTPRDLWNGLRQASNTLAAHLKGHPNKLFRLRLAVLFSSFTLIRHMASLESYYGAGTDTAPPPSFLDFSESAAEPVAHASLMTYILTSQSISRFYAWAFAEYLSEREQFTVDELLHEATPIYNRKKTKKKTLGEMSERWELARLEANDLDDHSAFIAFGEALYDILAQEAEGNPITYLRQLGHRSGLLWPPTNTHPTKRFALQQDMLETLVRGAVEPTETVDLPELQERFWERYNIVIGGRPEDENRLIQVGVYQADTTALEQNSKRFAARLSGLDFAELLADGVLKVELESSHAT